MGHLKCDLGGILLQFFHLELLSLVPFWLSWSCVVCVYFWIQWFFPLFEADNLQHIPKLTGDFGMILVQGQKGGEMPHNFQFGSLGFNIPEHFLSFIVSLSVKSDNAEGRTGRLSLIRPCCCGSRFFQLHELLEVSLHWLKS